MRSQRPCSLNTGDAIAKEVEEEEVTEEEGISSAVRRLAGSTSFDSEVMFASKPPMNSRLGV
jgi:hypothetical protein